MSSNPFQSRCISSLHLRVITHNIRYAASDLSRNERPWSERSPLILSQLHHELRPVTIAPTEPGAEGQAAFVCLQEVLHNQLVDVLAGLNDLGDQKGDTPPDGPSWAHIGVGRDDGRRKGEYSPILYPVKLFKLLHQETRWLSPTPDRPSKGWDAGSIRLLTVGVFEHRATRKRLVAANTHLDNAGSKSRFESVAIILETLKRVHSEWSGGSTLGLFLAGDFNSFPTQEAYQAVNNSGYLIDLHNEVQPKNRYGDVITFTGFEPEKDKDEQGRIDFIWLGPTSNKSTTLQSTPWTVDGYAVLPNLFEAGAYLSDHRAVVGDFTLQ
ncbi:endonuclease/exonuclease/phosphatase family protein [Hypoxylon rubiginosum]|uniref:Endonuclease/exonuclease/phosphatase family protein n=1 Tax=Hypoxylon rubiginosum TaxID=110542 RepID=A0ACC0CW35_9PEZI|nr:endonuclease/exonuclease/phosphatase family protein [Hypoxylon rubiginosum]